MAVPWALRKHPRLWPKIDFHGPIAPGLGRCWIYNAGLDSDGYGVYSVAGKSVRVHRFVYKILVGEIPAGLTLDHKCRVRCCVNPTHLEPVTNRVNTLRGNTITAFNARKTHCPQGHKLSGDNLRMDRNGARRCIQCRRKQWRQHAAKKYAKAMAERQRKEAS